MRDAFFTHQSFSFCVCRGGRSPRAPVFGSCLPLPNTWTLSSPRLAGRGEGRARRRPPLRSRPSRPAQNDNPGHARRRRGRACGPPRGRGRSRMGSRRTGSPGRGAGQAPPRAPPAPGAVSCVLCVGVCVWRLVLSLPIGVPYLTTRVVAFDGGKRQSGWVGGERQIESRGKRGKASPTLTFPPPPPRSHTATPAPRPPCPAKPCATSPCAPAGWR